jgi:NTE family protein
VLDQIDSTRFPRSGWRGGLNVYNSQRELGADESYTKWDIDGAFAYTFGNHTLNFAIKAGGKMGSDPLPRYDQFQWGGFLQQSGLRTGQLYGQSLQFGRAVYFHRILPGTLFEGAYGGLSLEVGRVGTPLVPSNPDGVITSGSVFVAADSPVGPAYFGYGRSSTGSSSFYFFLGLPY